MPPKTIQSARREPWSRGQLAQVHAVAQDWLKFHNRVSTSRSPLMRQWHVDAWNHIANHRLSVRATRLARELTVRPRGELADALLRTLVSFERKGVDSARRQNMYFEARFRALPTILIHQVDHPLIQHLLVHTLRHPERTKLDLLASAAYPYFIQRSHSFTNPELAGAFASALPRIRRDKRPEILKLIFLSRGPEVIDALVRCLPHAVSGTFKLTGHTDEEALIHALYRRSTNPIDYYIPADHPALRTLRAYVNEFTKDTTKITESPKIVRAALAHAFRPGWKPPASQRYVNLFVQQLREQNARGRLKAG